ncbi:MAG: BamA/TamA family outer membrane protein [Jaaginema sp. PMC 1079.18]|nr:BamA/TamA family outer membrane protein [Jaaginema sp. PMC 1080.18]MEC4851733.1 BamA/TamA family outer membrane protein [Jaaginema sp. PMC 1079.18]MEC4868367.1 BamA/TamA family outer membrane protein [Jaaginema sp. PMC 1078.18]
MAWLRIVTSLAVVAAIAAQQPAKGETQSSDFDAETATSEVVPVSTAEEEAVVIASETLTDAPDEPKTKTFAVEAVPEITETLPEFSSTVSSTALNPDATGDKTPKQVSQTPTQSSEVAASLALEVESTVTPVSNSPASVAQQPGPSIPEFDEDAVPVVPTPPIQPNEETTPPSVAEPRVLVSELAIDGTTDPELLDEIYRVISTQPGRPTTRSALQEDVNQIFATGFFSNVTVIPEDTPLGVRITFVVEPNPVVRRVEVDTATGNENRVLPQEVVDEIFGGQYGQILNLRRFQAAILRLNEWYQENGYDLAQVVGAPEVSDEGVVRLTVAEGVIENIQVRFFTDEDEPVDGKTRPFIVTREVELKPGDVFNRQTAQRDLERVFGLGIFDDVRFSFSPGEDPSQVVVNVDVVEASTGSIAAGAGFSSASGLFGTVSYQQQNFGGNNQTLGAELQIGFREFLFDVSFTDPWIATDPNRLSYTLNAFRRRSISLIFDEGNPEIRLPNGDRPRVVRTGGGIVFAKPLSDGPFDDTPSWIVSAGTEFQSVALQDGDGDRSPRDQLGNLLSFNDSGKDYLLFLKLGASSDRRNNAFQPTSGSLIRLAMDQSVPISGIFMNRVRGSYSQYVPVELTNFAQGAETIAFNIQGGTIIGDLPPYEAFALGGANSVRGYTEGGVGSGRSYVQLTAEYRFPLFNISQFGVGGALFVDYASDLGTGDNVPGNPAGIRNKPGSGLGYGLGVRVQSPLGPLRLDYAINDQGDSRIHFGIGERF